MAWSALAAAVRSCSTKITGPGRVAESRQQARHVGGVLPDGGLVQDVEHVLQAADQGQRQAHALRLAA